MGPRPVRHDDALPGLSPARARVLEFLQSQADPVGAEAVATAFGQHVNTVRGHLDALVGDGLALRHRQGTSGRGRPAWYYRANPQHPEPDARVREYGALAGALAAHLIRTSPSPADEARVAGIEWGRQIARDWVPAQPPPPQPTPAQLSSTSSRTSVSAPSSPPVMRRSDCADVPCWTWPAGTPQWCARYIEGSSAARSSNWAATTPESTCCRSPSRTRAN